MVSNEIYTGAGASVTLVPEMELKISEHFGDATHKLLATTADRLSLTWSGATDKLEPNMYRGCLAKLDRYNSILLSN